MSAIEAARNVRVLGSDEKTVVLCHGLGTDQSVWKYLIPHLVDNYKVLLYDNMGAGTTNPDCFDFDRYATLEGFEYDLIAILEEFRVEKCIYIGHSLSSMTGAIASIFRPDLFHKIIMIFASPSFGKDLEFLEVASSLGNILAERKIKLVYGGGNLGLMECVAKSAFCRDGNVLGIIPKSLADINPDGPTIVEELIVPSMHERIATMLYNSDAFIALGTLEEISCIASWAQLNMHQKPIGLYNVNGFYDRLLSFLDHCVEQEFMKPSAREIFISAHTADELIDKLKAYVTKVDPTLSKIQWQASRSSSSSSSNNSSTSKKRRLDLNTTL